MRKVKCLIRANNNSTVRLSINIFGNTHKLHNFNDFGLAHIFHLILFFNTALTDRPRPPQPTPSPTALT